MVRATKLPWIAALFAPALSCSLIVQFHDQDAGSSDGGPTGGDDASVMDVTQEQQVQDTGLDVNTGDDVAPETSTVDNWNPCFMKSNGYRCGNNGLDEPLPDADLVYCSGGYIGDITLCDAGCLHVVDPFPDSCNPCGGTANGDYCGRDLSGFNPDNADILIGCTGGQVGLQDACVHGCGSNGNMSSCYP
ncbi:MAG TPA: hypothetical protein VMI75_05090 [Polyangiaceae bacterium]|nr:hypothetical protein [Polyangiaceae bacterium]